MQFCLFTSRQIRSVLKCAVIPVLFVFSWTAIASSEQSAVSSTIRVLDIDLSSYAPVQTEWSEKAKANYEKRKSRDGQPIAMLTIGRLNIEAPVYFGTDRITLDRGLGMVEGTAYPDEVGNIAISGHRDGFFRPLKDIKLGDAIDVQTSAGTQTFEVSDISIVDALEVSVLDPTDTTVLTLITCHPFYFQGYAPDRYIVRATPVDNNAGGSSLKSIPVANKKTPTGEN
jgi:sortase A